MTAVPLVTVVIPARNEEPDIAGCLAAVAAQDHPHDRLEVVVVDGASDDATAAVAGELVAGAGYARAEVVRNDLGTTPTNLNVGLDWASGSIVCRVDARTRIEPHHVSTCASVLHERPDVAVVGGAQRTLARGAGPVPVGIARALNNRWAMGGSAYRSGAAVAGPTDTVYLGAFRTDDLRDVGGWDVRLLRNQDFDLNRRMAQRGLVWFDPRLRPGYVPRATLGALARQYHGFGRGKARYWRLTGDRPQARQQVLLGAAPIAVAVAATALVSAPRWSVPALAGGVLLVEATGTNEPPGGPPARAVAAAAMAVTSAAWWSGVVRGWLDGG